MSSLQQPDENDNPYNSQAATIPTTTTQSTANGGGSNVSSGHIQNIEPQFNDSHPAAKQLAPNIDYTAPQQPYYINPYSNNNNNPPQMVEIQPPNAAPNSGYVGNQRAFAFNLNFLKTIPGILNLIAIVSSITLFVFCILPIKLTFSKIRYST